MEASIIKKIYLITILLLITGCINQESKQIIEKDCLGEGEQGLFPCCDESLDKLPCMDIINGECLILECGWTCTDCGDGLCSKGENSCNCKQDCNN